MDDKQYKFYNNYMPVKNVRLRLNTPKKDYQLKAPYRDILGILESEKSWSEEDALDIKEIQEKIKYWDNNERVRQTTPPEGVKTIRNQLDNLYDDGLVIIEKVGRKNKYWKFPDEKVTGLYRFKIAKIFRDFSEPLKKLLCRHDVVLLGVFTYIVGTLLNPFHSHGLVLMVLGFIFFCVGHIMAYLGIPLFEYKRDSFR